MAKRPSSNASTARPPQSSTAPRTDRPTTPHVSNRPDPPERVTPTAHTNPPYVPPAGRLENRAPGQDSAPHQSKADTVTVTRADLQAMVEAAVKQAVSALPTTPHEPQASRLNTRRQPRVRREGMPVDQKIDPRTRKPHVPGQPNVAARGQTPDGGNLMVRATQPVYYELLKRRTGSKFALSREEDFNPNAMVWISTQADEHHVNVKEHLANAHEDALGEHAARAGRGQSLARSSARNEEDEVL